MYILFEIPKNVIEHCKEKGIGVRKMRRMFKAFVDQRVNLESVMMDCWDDFQNFMDEYEE